MDKVKYGCASGLALLLLAPLAWAQPKAEPKSDAPAAGAPQALAPAPGSKPVPKRPYPSVLKAVPDDVWGFLAAGNLDALDKDILVLIQKLGLGGLIQSSLVEFAMANLGLDQGLNTNGGLAVVVLPGTSFADVNKRVVLLLPSNDIKALTAPLGGADAGDGLLKATFMQQEVLVGSKNGYAVIAPIDAVAEDGEKKAKQTIKTVIDSARSVDTRMNKARLADFKKNDLYVWANLDALVKVAKKEGMFEAILAATQAQAGPDQQFQMFGITEILKLVDQASSVAVGLNIDSKGVNLHVVGTARPDTELGKYLAGPKDTDQPLFVGLPNEPFVIAMGQTMDKAQAKLAAAHFSKALDAFFASDHVSSLIDKEKLAPFKEKLLQIPAILSGELFAFSVSALPQGPDGLIGVAMVMDCEDSAAAQALAGQLLASAKELITDEQIKEALDVIGYKPKAETIDDVRVDHFVVDLNEVTELDAEDIRIAKLIVGNEGMLVRILAPTPKRLAIVFGGGKKRASQVIAACKAGQAPLAASTGIQRIKPALPKKRNLDFFIALDNGFALVKSIMTLRGENMLLPFDLPKVDAPVAIVRSGQADSGRVDLFIPIQLIQASAGIAMQAMMGGGI